MATKKTSATLPHLVDWRADRGMTQQALADAAGVGISSVKKAEGGGPLRPLTVAKLAKALGVSVDELRGRRPGDLRASA